MPDNSEALLLVAGALVGGIALLFRGPKTETGTYVCPYPTGAPDGLAFDTLLELQDHERAAHPGERITIDIHWGD